jgi:hypothetical protein
MSSYYIPPHIGFASINKNDHLLIYDTLKPGHHDHLKWYYNDLYQYFLFKLITLTNTQAQIPDHDLKRLPQLLTELLEAKNIIEGKED